MPKSREEVTLFFFVPLSGGGVGIDYIVVSRIGKNRIGGFEFPYIGGENDILIYHRFKLKVISLQEI